MRSKRAQAAWQRVRVAPRHRRRVLARLDHAAFDGAAPVVVARRARLDQRIDLAQPLEVDRQAIGEQRIEHESQQVPGTRRRGRRYRIGPAGRRRRLAARADDEHTVGAEVHGGTQRRELAHRAVAVELSIQLDRREDERNRRARHQHVEVDRTAHARPPHAVPVVDGRHGVEERNGPAGRIAGRRDGECVDRPAWRWTPGSARPGWSVAAVRAAGPCRAGTGAAAAASRRRASERIQCRPLRSTWPGSVRTTWSTEKFDHTWSSTATASRKLLARAASAAAFSAPADVPTSTSNGQGDVLRQPFGDRLEHAHLVRAPRPAPGQNQSLAIFEEDVVGCGVGLRHESSSLTLSRTGFSMACPHRPTVHPAAIGLSSESPC